MPNLLIVEDEPSIADALIYALKTEGFGTTHATTVAEARQFIAENIYDLMIFDVGLPDGSGFELCKSIRREKNRSSDIPILFLTARSGEVDRIVGLEIGGDDYVTKPFSPREVAARVRVILKRTLQFESKKPGLSTGTFELDDAKKRITFLGKALELSRYEYGMLKLFIENPGRVYSRAQLMDLVWLEPEMSLDRTVDAHIKTLRHKLREIDSSREIIVTHRGLGYSFAENLTIENVSDDSSSEDDL